MHIFLSFPFHDARSLCLSWSQCHTAVAWHGTTVPCMCELRECCQNPMSQVKHTPVICHTAAVNESIEWPMALIQALAWLGLWHLTGTAVNAGKRGIQRASDEGFPAAEPRPRYSTAKLCPAYRNAPVQLTHRNPSRTISIFQQEKNVYQLNSHMIYDVSPT